MKKILIWTIASVLFLTAAFFLGVPYLARVGHPMGEGSHEHARQWRDQLRACRSLQEIKPHFNCFVIEESPDRGVRIVPVSDIVRNRPRMLLKSFPDGRWIACAHASSHGEPGGGTIVTRDGSGETHIFFGHVCGSLSARGDTLEEFYADLRGYNGVEEVFLEETPR